MGTSDIHHTCKQGTILEESARVAVDKQVNIEFFCNVKKK